MQTWQGRIQREAAELKKDNEFIYHDKMPDVDSLAPIGRAALAKSLPLSKPVSSNFVDLFSKLVPMAVHNALQAYESRKVEIINFEVGRLREGTQLMNRLDSNTTIRSHEVQRAKSGFTKGISSAWTKNAVAFILRVLRSGLS